MPYNRSDLKHEIQNSRCLKLNKNNENPKKEIGFFFFLKKRLCSFEHIRHDVSYKKFHFLTKNRFLTNLFAGHLMHIKKRITHDQ